MNDLQAIAPMNCGLCGPASAVTSAEARCDLCAEKGNLVGRIVWKMVRDAVEGANERVTFMLVGLDAAFLEGIARNAPENLHGRSLLLRFNPKAAKGLQVAKGLQSLESAVHWRHNSDADVIVFAPSDEEREGIGAGLGPISRIDDDVVVGRIDDWAELIDATPEQRQWLKSMLLGLRDAAIHADLEMWSDFVIALRGQGAADPIDIRVKSATPALRIPRDGVTKLPRWKSGADPAPKPEVFRRAFRTAQEDVRPYASLLTLKQELVDIAAVRQAIAEYGDAEDDEVRSALAAASALLDDEANVRPGEWRDSQRQFCELVSWERIGATLFKGGRRNPKKRIGQQTLNFIQNNYQSEVIAEDLILLKSLSDAAPRDPKEEEIEFFSRWQERLGHPSMIKVYKAWQKRVFSKDVEGRDLLGAFFDGFEALVIAGADMLADMKAPRILVRATQHEKALYWEARNAKVLKLFRFELRSLQALFAPDAVCWDIQKCFEHDGDERATGVESQKVELELYLIDATDFVGTAPDPAVAKKAPRVKLTWQPGAKSKETPITLALPDDIYALARAAEHGAPMFRGLSFAPRGAGDRSRIASTTLSEATSFSDALGGQDGRCFDGSVGLHRDELAALRETAANLLKAHALTAAGAKVILDAAAEFEARFADAMKLLNTDTAKAFAGDALIAQAEAFGALCEICRSHAAQRRAREELRPIVARIGLVPSGGAEKMAILAAWHPLRLAERRAKIADIARFVSDVLGSHAARNADLKIAFEARREHLSRWCCPEVALIDDVTMVSVEDVGGASLMVPADSVAHSQEALETSAPFAAEKFIEGVAQFLAVHPHEATNLSAAIYDSESLTLPQEIAKHLGRQLRDDPDLRCDLIITHHKQERMQEIYRTQNTRLSAENISDTAKGFLSRLRVDVKPNRLPDGDKGKIRNLDLVFLHDAVSHYARPIWDHEPGLIDDLPASFDAATAPVSRRRLAEAGALGVAIYLTHPRPPRAVAAYQDLLYEMGKDAVLPNGNRGVLIREVRFDDESVKELIRSAHDIAKWVISCDKVSNRQMLEVAGIQIIRDISLPGSEGRVIISSQDIDPHLRANVVHELMHACGVPHDRADEYAKAVLEDVRGISGQKLLCAARLQNAALEMIGLSLMRATIEAALPADLPPHAKPIWISLDDYRSWLTAGKGKVADAVGVTVLDRGEGFDVYLQVGEAKFVGEAAALTETKEALIQVRDSVARLRALFLDNPDAISRSAWCGRLVDLLINRDGLSERLPDPVRRGAFLDALRRGDVTFRLSGEAVVSVHDDHSIAASLDIAPDVEGQRVHRLPTPEIKRLLDAIVGKQLLDRPGLRDVRWIEAGGLSLAAPEMPIEPAPDLGPAPASDAARVEPEVPVELAPATVEAPPEALAPPVEEDGFLPPPFAAVLAELAAQEQGSIDDPASRAWALDAAKRVQKALSSYNMRAQFTDKEPRLTPNGALISFMGHDSLVVDKIEKKRTELLTTHGVDVIDIRPGAGRISLFIKRDTRAMVPLARTWLEAEWPKRAPGEWTNFILGAREDEDSLLYLNIAGKYADYEEHSPHTLIAGETGSGKGVLTQSLLLQIIAFNDPQHAELILVDPKQGVDFGWLDGAPQMKRPIITTVEDAQAAFDKLVDVMDARYQLFADAKAKNIGAYNRKVPPEQRMSRIFLVHDELGAWMAHEKEYQETVLSAVASLGMKARAAGIHLILITQRADADAVPTKLRDNMGNRLCLKVQNSTGSTMVLNTGGAERLLGKGHLAAVLGNQNAPAGQAFFTLQVPYADDEPMERLAKAAIDYWTARAG